MIRGQMAADGQDRSGQVRSDERDNVFLPSSGETGTSARETGNSSGSRKALSRGGRVHEIIEFY